jgi:hypothetical protein
MTVLAIWHDASPQSKVGEATRRTPLSLRSTDVIPTGNEWISLPDIQASDGAINSFNVLSMRDRGLLEVKGD